jgi:sterol desaturase/sphingolipid hydroxylase (fatty acid hydroxylase superfamily)
VVGLLQIGAMLLLIAPLQRLWPVEPMADRAAVRVDLVYTLIHRLGLFKLVMFFTFENWLELGIGELRARGLPTLHLDQLWPGVTDGALASFLIYLVVFDFVNYWLHRAQHQFNWWWALHSLHHSQRQMTMWTDNRNHLLDDVLRDLIFVVVAILIGVAPGQFVALVAIGQLSESLQHANLRLGFGRVGERLLISPRFHRLHHSVGLGHETAGKGTLGGHNFGVLLPWWDMLFGTANFEQRYDPTGVRDQIEAGRDYGRGFWAQQRLGLLRLLGRA